MFCKMLQYHQIIVTWNVVVVVVVVVVAVVVVIVAVVVDVYHVIAALLKFGQRQKLSHAGKSKQYHKVPLF